MPNFISDEVVRLNVSSILVKRDERQRELILTDDLEESIRLRGLINPIVVWTNGEEQTQLIAGERRLTAFKNLGETTIPARFALRELSEFDLQILELEENVLRQELSWQEHHRGIAKIHRLCKEHTPGWTAVKTANLLNRHEDNITHTLRIIEAIESGKYPKVEEAPSFESAKNVLAAIREREKEMAEAALHREVVSTMGTVAPPPVPSSEDSPSSEESLPVPAEPSRPAPPIINGDFFQFAETYSGPPFNLLHCDFPYGINHQDSDQGDRSLANITYDDSPELYWQLCRTLASKIDSLISSSAHVIFWHAWKFHVETRQFFEENTDLWVQDVPLVWHKTDNRGIVADASRRPRNITEVAFIMTRGDRKIIKPVGNAYGAPTSKEIHQSEKPVPVLRHFLTMFVDENSRLLDPTSGSASALIAADSLGAHSVLGIEKSEDYFVRSSKAWNKYFTLKKLTERKDN